VKTSLDQLDNKINDKESYLRATTPSKAFFRIKDSISLSNAIVMTIKRKMSILDNI